MVTSTVEMWMLQTPPHVNIHYANLKKSTKSNINPVYGYATNIICKICFELYAYSRNGVSIDFFSMLVIKLLFYYDKYALRNQWPYFPVMLAVY